MDKLKSRILFILLIGIILCSVQAIAAADVSDAGVNDDVFDLSNDIETIQADSNDEILDAPSSDEVVRAEPDGSFSDLYNEISRSQTGTIDLGRNYVYNPTTDGRDSVIDHGDHSHFIFTYQNYDSYYINVSKSITINGNGHTIDGNGIAALFRITGAYTITLNDLNIVNCVAQPSTYARNNPNYYGAVINAQSQNVKLTINNCNITDNVANPTNSRSRAGAIYTATGSTLSIKDSNFKDNEAYNGGSIYAIGTQIVVENSNFTANTATNLGGAIFATNSNVTIKESNITNNKATNGGAIYQNGGNLTIEDSNISNNNATTGGGIYQNGGNLTIKESNITKNKATNGSAIYQSGGNLTISNTKILENQANSSSLTILRLNEHGTTFDGFYGTFTGKDNLINGIYVSQVTAKFTDVTYLGANGQIITTSTVPAVSTNEVGIPVNLIITQNGNVVKNITVYTNSSGGYVVTEEDLQLDYGTYRAYVIHYEDEYYTQIRTNDPRGDFYSYMYTTKITNATVEGYAGDTATVTFTVTRTRDDSAVDEGKVIVNINGHNYTANVNSQGRATVTITLPEEGGDFNVTYDGTGTSNWNATGTLKVIIKEKSDTEVTVTPQNIQVGTDETITFSVSPSDITGTTVKVVIVDSQGNEKFNGTVAISAGTVTVPNLPAGTYTVTVSYAGDIGHNPSEASGNFIVSKNASEVTVSPQNISVGSDEVISFTVTEGATGNVTITITGEGVSIVKDVPIVNGSITITDLAPGAYTVEVAYGGDDNFNASSASAPFTVDQLTPTVTVDTTDITYPETEDLHITVTGDGPVPTGTVNVTITDSEGHEIQSINNSIINNGIVVISVTGLAAGDYNVTVIYSGDVNYTVATGNGTFRVKKAVASVSVVASDITYPADEPLVVTVSGSGAVPSGNVTIVVTDEGGAEVARFTERVLNSSGSVSVDVSGLVPGKYNVTVTYNGDGNYAAGAEGKANFTIEQASATMSIETSDITVGSTENIVVTVSGVDGGAVPTGNVTVIITYEDGTEKTIEGYVLSDGSVTVPIEDLPAGKYNVTVTYNGDKIYTSTTEKDNFEVLKHNVTIDVITEVIGYTGDTIQVVINLTDENGDDVISGTVDYIIDFTNKLGETTSIILGVDVSDGTATVAVNLSAAPGTYAATVSYKGNELYNDAETTDEAVIMPLETSIESDDISGTVGDKVTVTAEIKDNNNNTVKNGTAVLTIDGKKYTTEVVDGKATFENVELPSKNTTATIEYLGNEYYNASSITVDVTVTEESNDESQNDTNDTGNDTQIESQPVGSKSVELLATGNPIAMLALVLLTLVSTISIRRRK